MNSYGYQEYTYKPPKHPGITYDGTNIRDIYKFLRSYGGKYVEIRIRESFPEDIYMKCSYDDPDEIRCAKGSAIIYDMTKGGFDVYHPEALNNKFTLWDDDNHE